MAYVGLFVYSDTFLIKRKGDFIMALFVELFLLGVGLSMDAFAVSVCKGLGMRKLDKKQALIIGLYFGGFQALMPLIGWLLGSQFQQYITSIDHWIAFILLGFIGGKMMVEAVREWNEEEDVYKRQTFALLTFHFYCATHEFYELFRNSHSNATTINMT